MAYADPTRVAAMIYQLLDRPGQQALHYNDVHAARIDSGMAIIKAIAENPENGEYGPLATLVTINHNQFIPGHSGKPGLPIIVPFVGASGRDGVWAEPDEIDSYRANPASYTGAVGATVAHDQAGPNNTPSPLACRYSVVQGRFKFTGYSAQLPLVMLTREMADTAVPEVYEPTLVKLSLIKLVKPKNELFAYARALDQLGREDLMEIKGGKVTVKPVPMPSAITGQKEVV